MLLDYPNGSDHSSSEPLECWGEAPVKEDGRLACRTRMMREVMGSRSVDGKTKLGQPAGCLNPLCRLYNAKNKKADAPQREGRHHKLRHSHTYTRRRYSRRRSTSGV